MLTNEQGFSLVETLFALLLFSLSFTALMHYQQALALGFQQQWQQREAWRNAQQRLEGQQMPGWRSTLQARSGPSGCQLLSARATGPAGRSAELTQLQCPANRG